tara:strand:- start:10729 stop:11502 length:774 start_codon:yes stop_codon:yes gene_type:complete
MEIWQAIILGMVQGITEWLPISSSGHLALIQMLFGLEVPISFDILLHFSTLLVLLTVYWKDLLEICKAWLRFDRKSSEFKLGYLLIIGTIPTAIIGLLFKDLFASFFSSILAIGIAYLFTAIILFLSKLSKENQKMSTPSALLVGLAQGIAIIPGVSRSGSTISLGLLIGINRRDIAKFSFLLALPAILGATILEGGSIVGSEIGFVTVLFGMVSAYIVGFLSLKWLLSVIEKKSFYLFGWYCLALGFFLISLHLWF